MRVADSSAVNLHDSPACCRHADPSKKESGAMVEIYKNVLPVALRLAVHIENASARRARCLARLNGWLAGGAAAVPTAHPATYSLVHQQPQHGEQGAARGPPPRSQSVSLADCAPLRAGDHGAT